MPFNLAPPQGIDAAVVTGGPLKLSDGSITAPAFAFASESGTGFMRGSGFIAFTYNTNERVRFFFNNDQLIIPQGWELAWTSNNLSSGTVDLALQRIAANHLGLASGDSFSIGSAAINSGTNVLQVTNGTAPSGATADCVVLYSSDNSAGNTIPSFYCEGTEVIATGQADSASSVRVKMRINGTVVTLLAI